VERGGVHPLGVGPDDPDVAARRDGDTKFVTDSDGKRLCGHAVVRVARADVSSGPETRDSLAVARVHADHERPSVLGGEAVARVVPDEVAILAGSVLVGRAHLRFVDVRTGCPRTSPEGETARESGGSGGEEGTAVHVGHNRGRVKALWVVFGLDTTGVGLRLTKVRHAADKRLTEIPRTGSQRRIPPGGPRTHDREVKAMTTTRHPTPGGIATDEPRVIDVSRLHYGTVADVVEAVGLDAHIERLGDRVRLVVG
jgi:hypothetical protein